LFSRSPVVGCVQRRRVVSATTAIDGSPTWSVDDDALPMTFFNPQTGEFADSVRRGLGRD
jgi:integrator complex subunit 6